MGQEASQHLDMGLFERPIAAHQNELSLLGHNLVIITDLTQVGTRSVQQWGTLLGLQLGVANAGKQASVGPK